MRSRRRVWSRQTSGERRCREGGACRSSRAPWRRSGTSRRAPAPTSSGSAGAVQGAGTGSVSRPRHFDAAYRSTVFDNRGIGQTRCAAPLPWSLADFANDMVELVAAVCDGPVAFVGLVARIGDRPGDRDRSPGRGPLRGRDGDRRVEHRVGLGLPGGGDRVPPRRRFAGGDDGRLPTTRRCCTRPVRSATAQLWPQLKALMSEWMDSGENEGIAGRPVGRFAHLRPAGPACIGHGAGARDLVRRGRPGPAPGRRGARRLDPERRVSTCSKGWAMARGTATPTTS